MTTKKITKKITKKTTKEAERRTQEERRQKDEDFIGLAKDLKEIVLNLNQRVSEVESLFNRIKSRLGL